MLKEHMILSLLTSSQRKPQLHNKSESQKNSLQQYLGQLQSKDLAICSITESSDGCEVKKSLNIIKYMPKFSHDPYKAYLHRKPIAHIAGKTVGKEIDTDISIIGLGDHYSGERVIMTNLGIDVGTKTIVISYKDQKNKTSYISEINGYWPFERGTAFIENMLSDPNKIRADGTKRPARFFKDNDSNQLIVLGKDAEEFAYSKNDTLLRPMAEGGITPDDLSLTVLTAIIHGLMNMAEKHVGVFKDALSVVYCTTAEALNKANNIDFHERVVDLILKSYNTEAKITFNKIKESHAIVVNMSPDGTGIGISWGAGTITVSYVKYGLEIYSFCWVGAGDYIDLQVAMRHGYDPENSKFKKKSKETPTTVSKKKTSVDLTPGVEYKDRLMLDIVLHYDVLISQVIDGIVSGFEENEAQARIDDGIDIFMAGGTSSPKGFVERVKAKFEERELPFKINNIKRHENPLFCVAEGCLKACEMF